MMTHTQTGGFARDWRTLCATRRQRRRRRASQVRGKDRFATSTRASLAASQRLGATALGQWLIARGDLAPSASNVPISIRTRTHAKLTRVAHPTRDDHEGGGWCRAMGGRPTFKTSLRWYPLGMGLQEPRPPADDPTLYEWAGGTPALSRMTRLFYEKYVPKDSLLAPLFANISHDHPERVAAWLGETFGGPTVYSERFGGYDWMVSQHLGRALTEAQRARWVSSCVSAPTKPVSQATPSSVPHSLPTSSGARESPSRTRPRE